MMFIFTRRTPRTLNYLSSSTKPMFSRVSGSKRRNLNWRNASSSAADQLIAAVRRRTDRTDLSVDLERVVADFTIDGYTITYVPGSAMFKECLHLEKD